MADYSMLVLLVEDDYQNFLATRDLIDDIDDLPHALVWKEDFESGLKALKEGSFSACLLDLHLGARSGIDFLKEAKKWGNAIPIVLFGDKTDRALEHEAMAAGAADFLVKSNTDYDSLRRTLRFALERTKAIGAIRERDQLFRSIFDNSRDAMIIADKDGNIVEANNATMELTGRSLDKLIGITADQLSPIHADPKLVKALWKEFMDTGHGQGEFEILRTDGVIRIAEYSAITNVLPGLQLSVLRDVTERRKAEISRNNLAVIVESANDAILTIDLEGKILSWNCAAQNTFGYDALEIMGKSVSMLAPPDRSEEFKGFLSRIRAGERVKNLETKRQTKSGQNIDVSVTYSKFPGPDGGIVGFSAIFREITEEKRLHTRLAILDRMASAGTLAAGLAHEINNPLATLMGYIEMAIESSEALSSGTIKSDLSAQLKHATEAGNRISSTVKDLRRFSLPEGERNSAVDLQAVMESSLRMAWNEIRHRATVVKNFDKLPLIKANESRIGQVFLNLLMNAAQSIEPGRAEENKIVISIFKDGDGVAASVKDTGLGMAPAELPKIFEAFYSSKNEIGGTGLGLAICKGIVEEMHGKITVTSSPGHGSCFTVHLPFIAANAAAEPSGKKKILIIDDEPSLLQVLHAALSKDHDVSMLKSTREALRRINEGDKFDAILCDMMMPDMTGMEFFKKLAESDPVQAKKVIFISGGAFTFSEHEFMESNSNGCLAKPFTREQLRTKVREVAGV